jgi:hypothetical protein
MNNTTTAKTQKKFVVVMTELTGDISIHRFGCSDTKKKDQRNLGTGSTIKSAMLSALGDFAGEYESEDAFVADYLANDFCRMQACAHAHDKEGN